MVRLHPYVDDASLSEQEAINSRVWPNPAVASFQIEAENITSVELISSTGMVVQTWNKENTYHLNQHSEGVYLLRIHTDRGISTNRIVIR